MGVSKEQVAKLYVATFNRAPDAAGLEFWVNDSFGGNPTLEMIASSFFDQPETQAKYAGMDYTEMVTLMYQNLFERDPDQAGLAYWVNELESGKFTPDLLIKTLIDGAEAETGDPADAAVLANKTEVGLYFSDVLKLDDVATGYTIMSNITNDPSSVEAAKKELDITMFELIKENSVLDEYTNSDDNIVGTEGNDYIDGAAGNDTIDGGKGHDILLGNIGNDTIYGGMGQDDIEGGYGADIIYTGSDRTYDEYTKEYHSGYYDNAYNYHPGYYEYLIDVWSDRADGGGGADKIYGAFGNDTLYGGDGDDIIYGDIGSFSAYIYDNDVLKLSNGQEYDASKMYNDSIYGESGDDLIYGGAGDDYIEGGDDNDEIYGGDGADQIVGGNGDDEIYDEDYYWGSGSDGADVIVAGDGNDYVEAKGNDNIDLGAGNDEIRYYTVDDEYGVIVAGDGEDKIYITAYDENGTVTIDLSETVESKDIVDINYITNHITEITGFNIEVDKLDVYYSFNLYGSTSYVNKGQSWNYDNTQLYNNFIQIVNSPLTEWLTKSDSPSSDNPEDDGKGIFVIQGASVSSEDKYEVAKLIDVYGNNATYSKSAIHYFLVNIENKGMGIYQFQDDTGADDYVHGDELTPVALLVGVYTEDIDLNTSANFII
jgi:hypothetical protein